MSQLEANKQLIRRLVDEVLNAGRLDILDELYQPRLAPAARRWIEPFLASFSDVHMRVDELIAEGDGVVGRFTCSGTHTGPWLGHPPTGRRFTDIAEVYIFRIADGRITAAWGLEDTRTRLHQLGLAEGSVQP
ncbi:MAG: ester cyclase [Jiangellaceae bacterium]